jgi:hypothetical protein
MITNIRTPYDQAEKAGKQLLQKAKEEHLKRRVYSDNQSYQAAKEGATFLSNKYKGKVIIPLDFTGDKSMNYQKVFGHN